MEKIKRYFIKILPISCSVIIILSVFYMVFYLANLDMIIFKFAFQVVLLLFIIYLILEIFSFKKTENLRTLIDEIKAENLSLKNKFLEDKNTTQEYFLMWIHQIKTPITSAKLISQCDESENMKKIRRELFFIEDYTNMALNYLKMNTFDTDMYITKVVLDDVIKLQLRKYSIFFISNGISLKYKPIKHTVITDSKWFSVVLEQILSNALKYTKNGEITIIFDKVESCLEIKDTGIGIKSSDLPKIFDRGYSGFNGKLNQKSTGIGLFLVKQITEKLGQKIEIESELNVGTVVKIYFPTEYNTEI
ncbi:MAG: sensor histidine kinase [Peptoniphilaceae bacterium]|uniref:sensor histidine kinase n=1 Tax=Parvimonas sp. TaxID=1944660 RepID=UPI0025D6D664|nr:sensor histidine kinase [Parvimonas sp.]MCI5997822.1 sensor histidine kinase [Parvimonas sp.]MDD7765360.1 sensor histidine kinase [Peptoniphilaceae bacterium]MDY3050198.1 sensor histidine kinase [Parvimonas sp.]